MEITSVGDIQILNDEYQKFQERNNSEPYYTIIHIQKQKVTVDLQSFFVYDNENKLLGYIRRQKIVKNGNETTKIILKSEIIAEKFLRIILMGDKELDCSDVLISVKYFLKSGNLIKHVIRRSSPFEFSIVPNSNNSWIAVKLELIFSPFQIVHIPIDKLEEYSCEIDCNRYYSSPRTIDNYFKDYSTEIELDLISNEATRIAQVKCDSILTNIITQSKNLLQNKHPNRKYFLKFGCTRKLIRIFYVVDLYEDIYSGYGGWAYFLWRVSNSNLYPISEIEECLGLSNDIIDLCLGLIDCNSNDESFFTGSSGIFALKSVICHKSGKYEECTRFIRKLIDIFNDSFIKSKEYEFEVLYGISGYLISILFAMKHIPSTFFDRNEILSIVHKSFNILCKNKESLVNFKWNHSHYFGAAHGISGILTVMLHFPELCNDKKFKKHIINSLNLLRSKYKNGFHPCSFEAPDFLSQWCHGSPGIISTYLKAHQVYKDDIYLSLAMEATKSIWNNGLLLKGFGMCHGILGNAYSFLQMYQYTKKPIYLYYAYQFCILQNEERLLVCIEANTDLPKSVDYSLLEGLSGIGCFNLDIQQVDIAAFPGYLNDIHAFT